ncbi:MAG TPA: TIR domain-containing protein, partial [Blastocatellia bacterium]|nr:TIR domain-containing protein [Blastocatellia bacterium]
MNEQPNASICRIFSRVRPGEIAGAGFLFSERCVFTCAHVLAAAATGQPRNIDQPKVEFKLTFVADRKETDVWARVVHWKPIQDERQQPDAGEDIAVLELISDTPAESNPAPMKSVINPGPHHKFRTLGFPAGHDLGQPARGALTSEIGGGCVFIQSETSFGPIVEEGFSGAPIWVEGINGVVGMVVRTEPDLRSAYMIPTERLTALLPECCAGPPLPGRVRSIFLIYDWEDRPEVRLLVRGLRDRSVDVAWDQDWPCWEDADKQLSSAINNADAVVVYSTERSQHSEWVDAEIEVANQAGKKIVVLDVEPDHRSSAMKSLPGGNGGNLQTEIAFILDGLRPTVRELERKGFPGNTDELLKAALEANLGVPSDTITDKIFVSPDACVLVEKAYSYSTDEFWVQESGAKAALEYCRLRRFQGEWREARDILNTALQREQKADPDLYHLISLELGALEFELGSTNDGLRLVRKALRYYETSGVTYSLVKALRQLGNMLREQGEWSEAMESLNAAIYISGIMKDYVSPESLSRAARYMLWSDCIRERASLIIRQGRTDEALEQFQTAYHVVDSAQFAQPSEHLRGIILYQLGRGYLLQKHDVKTAVIYLDKSLKILRKYDNPVRLSFLYDALGRAITEQHPMGDEEQAHRYFMRAKRIRNRCRFTHMTAYTDLGLGHFYRKQGDNAQAIKSYLSAAKTFSELGKTQDLATTELALGTTHAKTQNAERAQHFLKLAKNDFQKINLGSMVSEAEFEIFKLNLGGNLRSNKLEDLLESTKNQGHTLRLKEVGEYYFHSWINQNVNRFGIPSTQLLNTYRKLAARDINPIETDIRNLVQVGIGDDAAVL